MIGVAKKLLNKFRHDDRELENPENLEELRKLLKGLKVKQVRAGKVGRIRTIKALQARAGEYEFETPEGIMTVEVSSCSIIIFLLHIHAELASNIFGALTSIGSFTQDFPESPLKRPLPIGIKQ